MHTSELCHSQPYEPLENDEIRLIRLHEGHWEDTIQCELTKGSFKTESGRYIALSYAWGSTKLCRTISLGVRERLVTAYLLTALQRLRQQYTEGTFWIDALCINQEDTQERSHQVGMMRDIFRNAKETAVYLGEPISPYSFKSIPPAQLGHESYQFDISSVEKSSVERLKQRLAIKADGKSTTSSEARDVFDLLHHLAASSEFFPFSEIIHVASKQLEDLFEALRQLTRSRWWNRAWTVQEAVVPAVINVIYGSCKAPWTMFVNAAVNLVAHETSRTAALQSDFSSVLTHFASVVKDVEDMRIRWQDADEDEITLLQLLRKFSGRGVSDAHDKIYALLGLVKGDCLISPDYSLEMPKVFQDTVLSIIKTTSTLDVLAGDVGRKNRHDLPSWVPDWTAEYNEYDRRRSEDIRLYNATMNSRIAIMHHEDVEESESSDQLFHQALRAHWRVKTAIVPMNQSATRSFYFFLAILGAEVWKETLLRTALFVSMPDKVPQSPYAPVQSIESSFWPPELPLRLRQELLSSLQESWLVYSSEWGVISPTPGMWAATSFEREQVWLLEYIRKVMNAMDIRKNRLCFDRIRLIGRAAPSTSVPPFLLRAARHTCIANGVLTRSDIVRSDANRLFTTGFLVAKAMCVGEPRLSDSHFSYTLGNWMKLVYFRGGALLEAPRNFVDHREAVIALIETLCAGIVYTNAGGRRRFSEEDVLAFVAWLEEIIKKEQMPAGVFLMKDLRASGLDTRLRRVPSGKSAPNVELSVRMATHNRAFFIFNNALTSELSCGLGPPKMTTEDEIYIVLGASTPFVLRPTDGRASQLVGDCYVHGLMDGEGMKETTVSYTSEVVILE